MLFFTGCLLVIYVLPGAVYVFYVLKWEKAQEKESAEKKGHTAIESWWDLVIEKGEKSPEVQSENIRSLVRKKRIWFVIMILSWVLGTVIWLAVR